MAHTNKVCRSLETPDGGRCVDIFRRGDGSYGFAEYRRDAEDPRGWYPTGFHGAGVYATEQAALDAASAAVAWLGQLRGSR